MRPHWKCNLQQSIKVSYIDFISEEQLEKSLKSLLLVSNVVDVSSYSFVIGLVQKCDH